MSPNSAAQHQNHVISRIIRDMTADEFAQVLESLSQEDATTVASLLRKRLARRGLPENSADSLRKKLLFSSKNHVPLAFAEIIGQDLGNRSKEILGTSYENPTADEVGMLTEVLTSEFGVARTRIWYGLLVAVGVKASTHIETVARSIPGLDLAPHPSEGAPEIPGSVTDPSLRERRRERRQISRDMRARKRDSDRLSRRNNRKFDDKPTGVPTAPMSSVPPETDTGPIDTGRRVFPHLGRYPTADPHHDLVGAVVVAWIRFTTEPDTGKARPCVVLAVEPHRLVVKPLYSNPRFGAGFWRAIEIIDWSQAGLRNKSWAGDEIHTVRRHENTLGRLTDNDWNRICLGEPNTAQ
ncbi:MAG: hypothetical protein RLZZ544_983 [Actinomycetota bacterium]